MFTPIQYHVERLPYTKEPDYRALGLAGWSLVCVYDVALPPSPEGQPFDGRAFVFTRRVA